MQSLGYLYKPVEAARSIAQGVTLCRYTAIHKDTERPVLLKTYTCPTIEFASQLLRSALHLLQAHRFLSPMQSPFLRDCKDAFCSLTFVWQSHDSDPLVESNWPEPADPLNYVQLNVEMVDNMIVYADGPLFIKAYIRSSLLQTDGALCEAFTQVQLFHPNICSLRDIRLCASKWNRVEVHLVMEKMERDFNEEINLRKPQGRLYKEAELWHLLTQAVNALFSAKKQVIFM